MICDGNTEKRKDTRLKKCGSVSGGKIYKTNERSKIMSEPIFLRKDLLSYYSLQQHRIKDHGAKQRKPSDTVADLYHLVF